MCWSPDADWGGVRIAARIVEALPHDARVTVLDAGAAPQKPREPFGAAALDGLSALAGHTSGPVRGVAAAVLRRGYPVEQEASVRAVLGTALA